MRRILAAMALIFVFGCGALQNRIRVTNDTDEAIPGVTVSVCEQSWHIETLEPGETVTFTAVYHSDSHFQVDSPELSGNFGYVTHGLTGDEAVITFREDRIDFRQSAAGY